MANPGWLPKRSAVNTSDNLPEFANQGVFSAVKDAIREMLSPSESGLSRRMSFEVSETKEQSSVKTKKLEAFVCGNPSLRAQADLVRPLAARHTAIAPKLVIGEFQPGNPPSLANRREFNLALLPGTPTCGGSTPPPAG